MFFRISSRARIWEAVRQHPMSGRMCEFIGPAVEKSVIRLVPGYSRGNRSADLDVAEPDEVAVIVIVEKIAPYR